MKAWKAKKKDEDRGEELPEFYYKSILPKKREFFKEKRGDKIYWLSTPGILDCWAFSFDKKRVFGMWQDYPWNLTKEEKEIYDKENPFWADFHKWRCKGWECIEEHPPFKRKYCKREKGEKIFWVNTEDYILDIDEFSFDKKKIYNLYRDYPWELNKEEKKIFDRENPFSAQILYFRNFLERSKVRGKWVYRIKDLSDLVSGITDEEKEVTYKERFDCLKKTALDYCEYAPVDDLILEKDGVIKLKKDFLRF